MCSLALLRFFSCTHIAVFGASARDEGWVEAEFTELELIQGSQTMLMRCWLLCKQTIGYNMPSLDNSCSIHYARAYMRIMRADTCARTSIKIVRGGRRKCCSSITLVPGQVHNV